MPGTPVQCGMFYMIMTYTEDALSMSRLLARSRVTHPRLEFDQTSGGLSKISLMQSFMDNDRECVCQQPGLDESAQAID